MRNISNLLTDPDKPRQIFLTGDMNGTATAGPRAHDGIVSGGDMTYEPKRNGASTTIGGAKIDNFYTTGTARARLTNPTCFVIRNHVYSETTTEFRATCSDHFACASTMP